MTSVTSLSLSSSVFPTSQQQGDQQGVTFSKPTEVLIKEWLLLTTVKSPKTFPSYLQSTINLVMFKEFLVLEQGKIVIFMVA